MPHDSLVLNITSNWNGTGPRFLPAVQKVGAVFYLVLVLGGTLGNFLALAVIRSTRAMHTSKGVFTALAIADTVALWVNPVRYWLKFVFDYDLRFTSNLACKLQTFAAYTSRDWATWVLCLLTMERFLLTTVSHRMRALWRPSRAGFLWMVVLVLLVLKNAPCLWKLHILRAASHNHTRCDTEDIAFRQIFFFLDIAVYSVAPSLLLLVCNLGLMRVLRQAREHRVSLSERIDVDKRRRAFEKSLNHASRLLIPVSMFHLVTSLPICVFSVVEAALKLKLKSTDNPILEDRVYALGALFTMVSACNNGVNCIIYFLRSRVFRARLRRLSRAYQCAGSRSTRNSSSILMNHLNNRV